jgi:hypothetical protein
LVFENHGGRYFLSEIWFDADGRGLVLQPAKQGTNPERREIRDIFFQ